MVESIGWCGEREMESVFSVHVRPYPMNSSPMECRDIARLGRTLTIVKQDSIPLIFRECFWTLSTWLVDLECSISGLIRSVSCKEKMKIGSKKFRGCKTFTRSRQRTDFAGSMSD